MPCWDFMKPTAMVFTELPCKCLTRQCNGEFLRHSHDTTLAVLQQYGSPMAMSRQSMLVSIVVPEQCHEGPCCNGKPMAGSGHRVEAQQ